MRITWSEPALANLEAIYEYIACDAPTRAARFIQRLIAAVEPVGELPHLGRTVPEGDGSQREILFQSYRIIYRVEAEEVYVITVLHGARDLETLWGSEDPDAPRS